MVSSVETAKKILEDEVKNAPYTNDDPFSNATSFRKIIEYIYRVSSSMFSFLIMF